MRIIKIFCLVAVYTNARSAVVRAIGCLQLEMDAEHDDNSGVHMYSVHPGIISFSIETSAERFNIIIIVGSVKTPMTTMDGVAHPDMDKMKPGVRRYLFRFDLCTFYISFSRSNESRRTSLASRTRKFFPVIAMQCLINYNQFQSRSVRMVVRISGNWSSEGTSREIYRCDQ